MVRTMVSVDPKDRETVQPMLKRDGLTMSSFFRKCIKDYIDANRSRDVVVDIDDIEILR